MFKVIHIFIIVVGNIVETKVKILVIIGELKDIGIKVRTVILLHYILDSNISTYNIYYI